MFLIIFALASWRLRLCCGPVHCRYIPGILVGAWLLSSMLCNMIEKGCPRKKAVGFKKLFLDFKNAIKPNLIVIVGGAVLVRRGFFHGYGSSRIAVVMRFDRFY